MSLLDDSFNETCGFSDGGDGSDHGQASDAALMSATSNATAAAAAAAPMTNVSDEPGAKPPVPAALARVKGQKEKRRSRADWLFGKHQVAQLFCWGGG